jgi:hypothetical protein
MEGLASNFETVLKLFEEHLDGAMYAAVDMEFTGTDIDNLPDCYAESAAERLSKLCEVAEKHVPIQIALTLVKHKNNCFQCSSYNFYAFHWVGPELLGHDPSFTCKASAMQFNADKNHIDFNKWMKDAVPYMSREDEARYLASPLSRGDEDLPRKVGLLRVWKLLCEARVPLVTHCPLDIFFLLSSFERRKLPRDPSEMAKLILQCLPCIFDTAHLHGSVGGFRSLRLAKFLEDARARHAELVVAGKALPCCFDVVPETAMKYGNGKDFAHEAGFDSLCTAQLYAHLLNLSPEKVGQSANRLFLFKSMECLDLRRAAEFGEPGVSIFDLTQESFLVARLSNRRGSRALQLISSLGCLYKRMDAWHVLVIIRATGREAASMVTELDAIQDVQWLCFEEWRMEVRAWSYTPCKDDSHDPVCDISMLNESCAASSTPDQHAQPDHCGGVQAWLSGDVAAKQAKVPRVADALSWLGGVLDPEDPTEEDVDERTTTIGASSDCSSASDLEIDSSYFSFQ